MPSHSYQLSFESWTGWSHFFSGADEILEYWKRVAQKYDVRKDIKFENRCVGARWNDAVGKWFVQILDETDPNGRTFEDSADVLMTGTGMLNEWRWPAIPGLHKFKGKVLHSASWDRRYDTGVWKSDSHLAAFYIDLQYRVSGLPSLVLVAVAYKSYLPLWTRSSRWTTTSAAKLGFRTSTAVIA